ncbi:hypothetical protein PG985_005440 [Apiospora marii]|uniref:uncharacterized protein n=1 Tax=Apiospora marii TaxID=335849 RepID=UPI00313114D2
MPSPPRSPSLKKRQQRQPDADDYNGGSAAEYTRSAPSSDRKSPEETAATPRPLRGRTITIHTATGRIAIIPISLKSEKASAGLSAVETGDQHELRLGANETMSTAGYSTAPHGILAGCCSLLPSVMLPSSILASARHEPSEYSCSDSFNSISPIKRSYSLVSMLWS